jgi:hypothetical protein
MKLHENEQLFRQAVQATAERMGIWISISKRIIGYAMP